MTPTVSLESPADILAAVPYMLGFHPSDSVVVLGLRQEALVFQLRGDLPRREEVAEYAGYYARLVKRQRVTAAMLIGYGEGGAVTPVLMATARRLHRLGIAIPEMLRAHGGRYWSYVCGSADCCPADGTRYDVASSPVAAQATVSGRVALPSRTELERRFAPVAGAARTAMRAATARAGERLADLVGARPEEGIAALLAPGRAAVDAALARHRAGGRLADDELAWLSVLLGCTPVRDHAWRAQGGDLGVHVSLWVDVLRRAQPEFAAPPAALLGFAAWRAGEGAVASIAVDRALHADPDYPMARLLDHALRHGLSPMDWDAACGSARVRTRSAPA
jgi:hypothetical protein